ncbi:MULTISPECIES: XRE family transcriptional regulator [Rhodospirillales]|nr:XRE family transcriptional regulator [Rhodospirillum centenum]
MSGTRTLDDWLASLPPDRRERIEARADALEAEELTLQGLRKALDLTQAKIAESLDVRQDTVSRIERQTDMLLSTLSGYVEAMGGRLELTVRFPGRPPVRITGLSDL